jgi:hypothetical protein
MRTILVLAADRPSEEGERTGDLFDAALLEIVRVLDISEERGSVLVPWSDQLAPLIAVAAADTAPSFDPEGDTWDGSRSSLIPYRPTEMSSDEWTEPFRAGSHLSLTRARPFSFVEALDKYPPQDIIVLSIPENIAPLRPAAAYARFFVFGSLLSRARVAAALDIPAERVEDLEQRLRPLEDVLGMRRPEEERLEPFIPFGLLIQDVFDEMLPDDGRS